MAPGTEDRHAPCCVACEPWLALGCWAREAIYLSRSDGGVGHGAATPAVAHRRASAGDPHESCQASAFSLSRSYSGCEMTPSSSMARAWAIWSAGAAFSATSRM